MGILRFFLAVAVIAGHCGFLGFPIFNGASRWPALFVDGREAVCFFYIISGFYMAMVLNTKYLAGSNRLFYFNRFLRLWPAYVFALVLSLIFLPTFKEILALSANCSFLDKAYIWLSNIFILGSDGFWFLGVNSQTGVLSYLPVYINESSNGFTLSMNVPSFSIAIEMIFYMIAPFILRSLKRTWLFLLLGIGYYFYILLDENLNIAYQYHFFPSSFVYFALGALSWHYFINKTSSLKEGKEYILIFMVVVLLMFSRMLLPGLIIIGITFSVPLIFNFSKDNKWDRFVGELSYPLYILHYPVLLYLKRFSIDPNWFGLVVVIVTVILAIPVHLFIEKPIDNFRQRRTLNNAL